MDSGSKIDMVSGPPPRDRAGFRAGRMLEVAPPEEGEGESRKATASPKEALERGGIENPSLQGEKRTASEDPGAKAPKRGKKSSPEGPTSGEALVAQSPLKSQPSNEP